MHYNANMGRGVRNVIVIAWGLCVACGDGDARGDAAVDPRVHAPDGGDPPADDAGRVWLGDSAAREWPGCEALLGSDDAGAGDCPFDEAHAVYVDASRGDDTRGDGTRDRPFATLGAAVASASAQAKRVHLCGGPYTGPLQIVDAPANALTVLGSLSCETFLPDPDAPRTVVLADESGPALHVRAASGVRLEHLDFRARPSAQAAPGSSFVAAFAQDADGLVLLDVTLEAAAGLDGADALAATLPAASGSAGLDGTTACERNPNLGGLAVQTSGCTGFAQPGGSGGNGGVGVGAAGSGTFNGASVPVGEDGPGWGCGAGEGGFAQPGFAGFAGAPGRGARGFGAIVAQRFIGFAGQAGSPGGNGSAGWGGGGARAPVTCAGLTTPTGASGGSGGGGGCGGAPGAGGGAGGSSIALISVDCSLSLRDVRLMFASGGAGGEGAAGQMGGAAGPGGTGGAGSGGSRSACDGASGGAGGVGGPGGGGNGGHAIGLLYVGSRPRTHDVQWPTDMGAIVGGAPGRGAPSGQTDTSFFDGRAGISEAELPF